MNTPFHGGLTTPTSVRSAVEVSDDEPRPKRGVVLAVGHEVFLGNRNEKKKFSLSVFSSPES